MPFSLQYTYTQFGNHAINRSIPLKCMNYCYKIAFLSLNSGGDLSKSIRSIEELTGILLRKVLKYSLSF